MYMITCTTDSMEIRPVNPLSLAPSVDSRACRVPPASSDIVDEERRRRTRACNRGEVMEATVKRGCSSRPAAGRQRIGWSSLQKWGGRESMLNEREIEVGSKWEGC
jgi:hypothetical protein